MNFLIADVIQFSSNTKIIFSHRNVTKLKAKQFSDFGSRTIRLGVLQSLKSVEDTNDY